MNNIATSFAILFLCYLYTFDFGIGKYILFFSETVIVQNLNNILVISASEKMYTPGLFDGYWLWY